MALLVVGGLLLLAIVLWELVQRWRAARADAHHLKGPLGQARDAEAAEPTLTDPIYRNSDRNASSIRAAAERAHAVSDDSQNDADDARREPTLTLPEIHVRDRLVEPPLVDLDSALDSSDRGTSIPIIDSDIEPSVGATVSEPDTAVSEPVKDAAAGSASASAALSAPGEVEEVIVALRVVARNGERFIGASLRQALQGEGFVHGDLGIFHRSVGDGRTLLSAASLTKPGNFDLETMDAGRYLGLNLFAVLPGPLPGRETVDKLLLAGHTLAKRLKGDLLDSKGQPLTEARLAEMRREAGAAGP